MQTEPPPTRPRVPLYPIIIIAIIVLLAIAVSAVGLIHHKPPHHPVNPTAVTARLNTRSVAHQAAARFLGQLRSHHFGAQWDELTPVARSEWPSKRARTRMLTAKFAGVTFRYSIGRPAPNTTWFSHESAGRSVSHLWRVPVALRFSRPLRPPDVAAAYGSLALYLRIDRRRASIVGEGPAAIDAPIILPASAQTRQVQVPILMYHRVGPFPQRSAWNNTYGYEIESGLTVPPARFRAEMAYLGAHGYTAISFPRLVDALLYGLPLPRHPVAITFDDGRLSPYVHAVPVLKRHGFTATFFICAGFAGQTNQTPAHLDVQRYLSWRQMATLSREGFWVEDHGVKDINELYSMPMAGLRVEAGQTAGEIQSHTGQPVQFVAYTGGLWPYPSASESDAGLQAMFARLARLGYVGAVTDTRVPGATELSNQLMQFPRVRVQPNESIARFAASLQTP